MAWANARFRGIRESLRCSARRSPGRNKKARAWRALGVGDAGDSVQLAAPSEAEASEGEAEKRDGGGFRDLYGDDMGDPLFP